MLRSALVVAEIALALVLLTGAGLMLKSFLRLRAVDPGFRPENVLTMTVDLPDSVYHTALEMRTFHERALAKLSALPDAVAAAAVNFMPLAGPLIMGDFHLEGGRPMPPKYIVDKPCVSPGYFRAMGIRLLRGREFTDRDNDAAPGVVILSQSVAKRLWPGEDPLGQRITTEDHPTPKDWLTIIGVVDDVRQQSLSKGADHAIYRPYLQVRHVFFLMHMTFAVRTASDPRQLAPALRKVLHEVDRDRRAAVPSQAAGCVFAAGPDPLGRRHLRRPGICRHPADARDRHPHGAGRRVHGCAPHGAAPHADAGRRGHRARCGRCAGSHARAGKIPVRGEAHRSRNLHRGSGSAGQRRSHGGAAV